MEEEERKAECNVNNVTMDTFYLQSTVTNNAQGEIANMTNGRKCFQAFWQK